MKLKLLLVQKGIDSPAEVKMLGKIQQKQLDIELRAYFGKKVSLKEAFDGECVAAYYFLVNADQEEKVLYNLWLINSDSAGVFHHDTADSVGVEMIQGSFVPEAKFAKEKEAIELALSLTQAERGIMPDPNFIINEQELVIDFKTNQIPTEAKEWLQIIKNRNLSEAFVVKYQSYFNKACWKSLVETVKFSEAFLSNHLKHFTWEQLSKSQQLSESFIRKYASKVDWTWICFYQTLSEDFIREFQDKVNWDYISSRQTLSEAFILEFSEKLNWEIISWSQKLSVDTIRKFIARIHWANLLMYQPLEEVYLREFADYFDWSAWIKVAQNQVLSDAFIKDFSSKLDWGSISMNLHLTDAQLELYQTKLSWNNVISFGRTLSEAQLQRYKELISNSSGQMKAYTWKRILEQPKKYVLSEAFKKEISEIIHS